MAVVAEAGEAVREEEEEVAERAEVAECAGVAVAVDVHRMAVVRPP